MKNELLICTKMKKFIFELDKYLINFPNKEKVLRDNLKTTCFSSLELIIYANLLDERLLIQKQILAKLSMLDFFLEESLRSKYLSYSQVTDLSRMLNEIIIMVKGWIKSGS